MGALYKTTQTGCKIIAENGRNKYTVLFPDGSMKKNIPLKKAEDLCNKYAASGVTAKERIVAGTMAVSFVNVMPQFQPIIISFNKQQKQPAIFINKVHVNGGYLYNFYVGDEIISIVGVGLENLKLYPDESDKTLKKQLDKLIESWQTKSQSEQYIYMSITNTPMVISINGSNKQQVIYMGQKHENNKPVFKFKTVTGVQSVDSKFLANITVFPNERNNAVLQQLLSMR